MNELKKEPYQDNEQSINTTKGPALSEENEAAQNPITKEEFFEFCKQVIDFAKKPSKSQEDITSKEKPTKISELSKINLKEIFDEMSKTTAYSAGLISLISYWEEHKEDLDLDEDRLNDLYDSFNPLFDDLIEDIKSNVYVEKNKFSEQLKEARTAKGLTQKVLARQTKIPLRTIEAWEAEERIPPEYVQRLLLNKLKEDKMNQKIIPTISDEERKERFEEMKNKWNDLGDFGEGDYDEKKIENEFYIDTLDGKFHVYSFNLVTNYNEADEPDGYVHFINIDFINKDGFRVRMNTNRYDYSNTYKRDQNGNFIWRQYADEWTGAFSIVEPEISDSNQIEELKAIFYKTK